MTTITFDTLKFVETLKAHGLPDERAKGIAAAFRDAAGETDLATRQDVREAELKLEARIVDSKAEPIRWVVAVGILQITLIAALLLKLAPG